MQYSENTNGVNLIRWNLCSFIFPWLCFVCDRPALNSAIDWQLRHIWTSIVFVFLAPVAMQYNVGLNLCNRICISPYINIGTLCVQQANVFNFIHWSENTSSSRLRSRVRANWFLDFSAWRLFFTASHAGFSPLHCACLINRRAACLTVSFDFYLRVLIDCPFVYSRPVFVILICMTLAFIPLFISVCCTSCEFSSLIIHNFRFRILIQITLCTV